MSSSKIVILGGGFGGLAAANELREKLSKEVTITVIDKKDWFMMDLVKLWIIKGTRNFESSKRSLDSIKKKGIEFVNEDVLSIDPKNKFVKTKNSQHYFDYLIIAMGVELAPEKIPGLKEHGLVLYDLNHARTIHEKIMSLKSGKLAFSIMGMPYKCPPAPFEAALIINSMLEKNGTRDSIEIDFFSPAPLTMPAAGPEVSNQLLKILDENKIKFHGSCKPISVEKNKIKFENSEENFDLLIAVPPHKAPRAVIESGFANEGEYISVNRDCKTKFDNVYAVGDVNTMKVNDMAAVPKAGIFAEGQGITVARNIVSQIQKEHESAIFDGKGGCFVELGKESAGYVEVDMFAKPNPITLLKEPAKEHMIEKERFEKERLEKWL